MRELLAVTAMIAATAGCKSRLEWKAQHRSTIEQGPFKFDIPAGWRELGESADPALAMTTHELGRGAFMIVRENDSNTDTSIAFMWSDPVRAWTCDQFIAAMETQSGAPHIDHATVREEKIRGDQVCSFQFKDDDSYGMTWTRTHGDRFMTLQCMRPRSGDANGDATCLAMAEAMRAQ